jgi:hypothetical protein
LVGSMLCPVLGREQEGSDRLVHAREVPDMKQRANEREAKKMWMMMVEGKEIVGLGYSEEPCKGTMSTGTSKGQIHSGKEGRVTRGGTLPDEACGKRR